MVNNPTWDTETSVIATCSFTTGSCSLSVYKLTAPGIDWGKANRDNVQPNPPDFNGSLFEKVQMILSDKFLGFFMVPEGGAWNYNFNGQNFSENMRYTMVLDTPKDFYSEIHRSVHFLDFTTRMAQEETTEAPSGDNVPDRDDFFQ